MAEIGKSSDKGIASGKGKTAQKAGTSPAKDKIDAARIRKALGNDRIEVESRPIRGNSGRDLGDTLHKARMAAAEQLVKENAARQAKYDKAMKAADSYIKSGDEAKAIAELKKAHDGADETWEELQVAKKAASLGDRKLAWDALYAARNRSRSPAAAEQVASTAESLGFFDIGELARDDAEDMRQEKAEEQAKELAEKQAEERKKSSDSSEPARKSPEFRKSPLLEVMTDPLTMGVAAIAYGAYLESQESGKKSIPKTKRKR